MIKFGNKKLGDDTLVFNMTSAKRCPARSQCEVIKKGIRCYAEKAEIQYPKTVVPYREKQESCWRNWSSDKLIRTFEDKITRRTKPTRYFRFNESGDFKDQGDIKKLSRIARDLKRIGVTTYGYTARSDLDFRGVDFLVKGSGNAKGNNGRSIVIEKTEDAPKGFVVCPGSCKTCDICKKPNKINVAFRRH
jgi:hypothetical protein